MAENHIDSNGVAQTIILEYFQSMMGDRSDVISFYGHNAVLFWKGQEFSGNVEISAFLNSLPETITFQISGFEVQTVPNTDLWTMLVVFGTYQEPRSKLSDFHCTFIIDSKTDEKTAFIRYHHFQTY